MNVEELILDFLINIPALITLLVAIIVTVANWRLHPPAARWALLAFVWMFITYIISIVWRTIGRDIFFGANFGPSPEEIFSLVVISVFESLAYFFILIAMNVSRTPYRSRQFYEEEDRDDDRLKQ
jgi:hypothetical protein